MLFWLSTRMMKKQQVVLITILLLVSLTRICRLCGITYKADKIPFGASLLFMNLGLETGNQLTQDSHTRYLQTMGTYLTYKNSGWNLDGAFYYQTGKNKDARVFLLSWQVLRQLMRSIKHGEWL